MVITSVRKSGKNRYYLDGKAIKYDDLVAVCRKVLTASGITAMWRKLIAKGKCVLDLEVELSEQTVIEGLKAEVDRLHAKNRKLSKKLMESRIKAAKYDGLKEGLR